MTLRGEALQSYAFTCLFCLAITGLLWFIEPDADFTDLLVVSFCIGLSVATASLLLGNWLEPHLPPYLVPVPLTLAGLTVGLLLAGTYLGDPGYFFDEGRDTWIVGIFFGVVGILLLGAYGRLQTARAALARARAERLQQEKQALETHLRLLQAQIEPHFLFNTLSNVGSMIRTAPAEAEQTLEHLTTLLRVSLRRTRLPLATLGDELEILRAYLEIQRIRMGDRMRFSLDCEAGLTDVPLPPLLLQPLVENAVRHGLEPLEQGGCVAVRVRAEGDRILLEVSDTGRGICSLPAGDYGTGIANVLGRLEALYHGRAALEFTRNTPNGLKATLSVPREPYADSTAG